MLTVDSTALIGYLLSEQSCFTVRRLSSIVYCILHSKLAKGRVYGPNLYS
jgi:hypothetical protein